MARGRGGHAVDMTTLALTILAANATENTQAAPDDGLGAALIIGTLVAVAIAAVVIWLLFTRLTRRSRGGVEAPEDSQRRGAPPFEGVERGG
jgi:hypothetical protein